MKTEDILKTIEAAGYPLFKRLEEAERCTGPIGELILGACLDEETLLDTWNALNSDLKCITSAMEHLSSL